LAGLVSLRDKVISADCLIALEGALKGDASGENSSPSA